MSALVVLLQVVCLSIIIFRMGRATTRGERYAWISSSMWCASTIISTIVIAWKVGS